jgi:DNA-binding LytR/AlgR family response regulator
MAGGWRSALGTLGVPSEAGWQMAADTDPEGAEALRGRSILIVEDGVLVALDLETLLASAGARIIGPAARVDPTLALMDTFAIDAALLDINLGEEHSLPVAYRLRAESIPFAFVTAHRREDLVPADLHDVPVIDKPYRAAEVLRTLAGLLAERGGNTS